MYSIAKLIKKNDHRKLLLLIVVYIMRCDYNYYKIRIYRVNVNFFKNFIKNLTVKCTLNHNFKVIDIIFI